MERVTRRGFVGTMTTAAGVAALPAAAEAAVPAGGDAHRTVYLYGDGIELEPAAYAALLHRLTSGRKVQEDAYLLEGEVAAFERTWAALLGKERAVFMPSGTLANQLALRALAGDKRRVIVQDTSHVYNDTGDACQTLSRLTLVPLAPNAATYSRTDVEAVLARTAAGRVATGVGALSIESPVRRRRGEMFDWDEAQRICAFARERGIGTHLDGARLFIASAYTGITPKAYAAPFDTVYVSLWKYFNSGIGAILAGPARLLDEMHHTRRMFGGNLWNGWPAAVVARHYMDGFVERLRAAVAVSEDVFRALAAHPRVTLERTPSGTNVTLLTLRGVEPATLVRRLADRGVKLGTPSATGVVAVNVNETWTRMPAPAIVQAFEHALA
jgi:threonine aldolase